MSGQRDHGSKGLGGGRPDEIPLMPVVASMKEDWPLNRGSIHTHSLEFRNPTVVLQRPTTHSSDASQSTSVPRTKGHKRRDDSVVNSECLAMV